jgi:hypothetical protein
MSDEKAPKRGRGRPRLPNAKNHLYCVRMDRATDDASKQAREDGIDLQALTLAFIRRTLKAKGYLKPTD